MMNFLKTQFEIISNGNEAHRFYFIHQNHKLVQIFVQIVKNFYTVLRKYWIRKSRNFFFIDKNIHLNFDLNRLRGQSIAN